MARSYNKFTGIGTLVRDVELRYTPSGKAFAKFTLAFNDSYKTASGELKETATFIDCNAWNAGAEAIAKYVGKGNKIMVDGRIVQENWDDKKTGQKRSKLALNINEFQFIGFKDAKSAPQDAAEPKTEAAPAESSAAPGDDEVPF